MIEKFLKNPVYTGAATMLILVVVLAWVYDEKTNPRKDFYGLLKVKTPKV